MAIMLTKKRRPLLTAAEMTFVSTSEVRPLGDTASVKEMSTDGLLAWIVTRAAIIRAYGVERSRAHTTGQEENEPTPPAVQQPTKPL